jgi:23S rRNA (cytosine1962-C5)-methyltransferase
VEDAVYRLPGALRGPWIFRKMILFPERGPAPGSYIALRDREGRLLARGLYNRRSEIAFRCLGGPEAPAEFGSLLRERLRLASRLRREVLALPARTDAFRLVNSEGDGLSGLVVDLYADTAVLLVHSIGYVAHAETVESELRRAEDVRRILWRSDARTAGLEGFHLPPLEPGLETRVSEDGLTYLVDLSEGHKSGLFLDQRDQRWRIRGLARGRSVLDLATNAGGFALSAAAAGAREVLGVDLDEKALQRAQRNAAANRLHVEWVHADLFPWLRARRSEGRRFELVILDPPRIATGPRDRGRALATYRDMNRHAFEILAPGGLFLTCSCSGAVGEDEFLGAVVYAAREAGRRATVLGSYGAAPDHPVSLEFPEGRYLKCLILNVE